MAGPFTGLTVLDFSMGMPGAITTLILADFGAEVIKVEPPGGDPFRFQPAWLAWNRGKQGVVLDLEAADGREQAVRLAERADVLVESFQPGETTRLGIDFEALSSRNPGLVYCSITGFGQKGRLRHLKGYEGIVAAKVGRMLNLDGQTQREGPVYSAVQTGSWHASAAALRGITAALRVCDITGHGQWLQTSIMQGMIPHDNNAGDGTLLAVQLEKRDPKRFPRNPIPANQRHSSMGYIPVRTKDGQWIQHGNVVDRVAQSMIRAMGLGHLLEDERFAKVPNVSPENREILRRIILERMQEKTLDEWMDIYIKDGNVAAEPYRFTHEGMQHEAFVANRHVVEVQDPRVGPMKQLGLIADLRDTPGEIGGPAPDVGQHTAQVLERLNRGTLGSAPTSRPQNSGQTLAHPLDGITVLDLSTVQAGPYSTTHLADMGARVIKVDATYERRDERQRGAAGSLGDMKTYPGKEGIMLDLQAPEGREIMHKLIAGADILVHNFRPGVPVRLQVDYETCHAINPRLVHVYMGTYGATGRHGRRPGAHPIPGALMGGARRQFGRDLPSPETPMTMDEIVEVTRKLMKANWGPDQHTSAGISSGIMLGLRARDLTGIGQPIQVTMICATGYANADEAYDFAGRPAPAVPDGELYGLHALYRLYQARVGWVFLACIFDQEWQTFCRYVGRANLLTDSRFATADARRAHDEELIAEISKVFTTRTAAEWEALLTKADVACVQADAAVEGAFYAEDPHAQDNEMVVEVEHAMLGPYLRFGGIVHFSLTPGLYRTSILPGQHTRPILRELGYTDAQVEDLRERRIVDWEVPVPIPMPVG